MKKQFIAAAIALGLIGTVQAQEDNPIAKMHTQCDIFTDFVTAYLENVAYVEGHSKTPLTEKVMHPIYRKTALQFDNDFLDIGAVGENTKNNVRRIIATHQKSLVAATHRLSNMNSKTAIRTVFDICADYELSEGPNRPIVK